jgi:hypothetical protein
MKNETFPPLTERARKLFSKLVDANWELKEYQENNRNSPTFFSGLLEQHKKYIQTENELIAEIGQAHYDHYISMGRKMFA